MQVLVMLCLTYVSPTTKCWWKVISWGQNAYTMTTKSGKIMVNIKVFFSPKIMMRSWKSVCGATPATNPGTSSVSLGFQVLKEHQGTRDSYVCLFINFDKSNQDR